MSDNKPMDAKQENDEELMVDVVTFIDDEGNEFEMEIIDEFAHKGLAYAVLAEIDEHEHDENCDHENEEEESLFIFEVTQKGDEEEFTPIEDDDLLDELTVIVEGRLFEQQEKE